MKQHIVTDAHLQDSHIFLASIFKKTILNSIKILFKHTRINIKVFNIISLRQHNTERKRCVCYFDPFRNSRFLFHTHTHLLNLLHEKFKINF